MANKFVDLKRTKADKKAREESYKVSSPDSEDYPYGLRVRLGTEELKKLGIKSLPKTGATMYLEAQAHVCSTTDSTTNGRNDRSIELELRKVCLESQAEEDAEESTKRGMRGAIDAALSKRS